MIAALDAAGPIAPAWAVLPIALIAAGVTAWHVGALQGADARAAMPASRRRIRTANGVVSMVAIPVLAWAFGVVSPEAPRSFTLAWSASAGLLGIIVLLAATDVLNTARLARRTLRRQLVELRRERGALEAQLHASLRRPPDRGDAR